MANASKLSPGTIFQGAYEIVEELGRGTFGRVYQARQLSTGQMVAMKILRVSGDRLGDEVTIDVERFRREIRVLAELSHPNIVRLIDSGETPDATLYAIFELVPGLNLRDLLAAEGSLGWDETVHLMSQVLDALSCAHARGVVHRDLKPENIMVTETGARRNTKLVDFGLGGFSDDARGWQQLPRLTATQEMMGTPCYVAPEQLRGEPPSPRSDLYSWGLIFLECLTGELAIGGASAHEVVAKQLGSDPVSIPGWIRDRRLRQALETVTAKQIEKRDVTVEALLRTLAEIRPESLEATRQTTDVDQLAEGERRQVTVLCCSLGFSSLDGRALDVEELDRSVLVERALCEQVAAHNGGRVASVLGDRLLIVFGFPQAREDTARRAAHAALEIAAALTQANALREPEARLRGDVRIGVHTGLVIVRPPQRAGEEERCDAVGLTPQIAIRLQELASPNEILVSADTQRLLRGTIASESAGQRRIPELSAELAVFRLTEDRSPRTGLETFPWVLETPLVGRAAELQQIQTLWSQTTAGRGSALLVSGEAGIGKSRMIRELRRRVPPDGWLEARCVVEGQGSPLRPIADTLALAGPSLAFLLERHGFDVAEHLPLLTTALALPTGGPTAPLPLTPDRQKELAFTTLLALFFRMAEVRPLVIAVEDLQWADPTTLELLALLVRELGTTQAIGGTGPRIALVFTARPEFTPPWSVGDTALMVLQRLARKDVEEMVCAGVAGGRSPSDAVLDQVVQHADGIPLFIEEVTRVLMSSTSTGDVEIPSSLRDLLAARLDGLRPSARETAQLASVLGREFRGELLRAASPKDESTLRTDLRELTDTGVVFHRRSARSESYVFKHALIRDAAYETMVRPIRQSLHRRVAVVLRQRFPEVEHAQPEVLAHHFERGGQIERAVEYWKRAGDRTMARGAYAESIQHFEHGLALLDRLPEASKRPQLELGLTESLGTALLTTRGYSAPEVAEKFAHALKLCERLGEEAPARVLYGTWTAHLNQSDRDATARLLVMIRRLGERSDDPVDQLLAHGAIGIRAFLTGDFVTAREECEKSLQWYDTEGYRRFVREYGYDGGLHNYVWLMWSRWMTGQADQALKLQDDLLGLAERNPHPYSSLLVWSFAAVLAHDRGDAAAALDFTTRSIAVAMEQKFYYWLGPANCVQGWAAVQLGRIDEGVAQIQQGLGLLEAIGFRVLRGYYLSYLAEADLARGALRDGPPAVREALGLAETLLDSFYVPELHRLDGELRRLDGDLAGAEACFRRALAHARQQQATWFEQRAATSFRDPRLRLGSE
jgi:TOMM system kinase/cyclase fusion protein